MMKLKGDKGWVIYPALLLAVFYFSRLAFAQGPAAPTPPAVAAPAEATPGGVIRALSPSDIPKKIETTELKESIEERLARKITLDVRDMNIIDVIKFLAMKGDFNVVTSKSVSGRVTLLLKSVSIKDVLDIILISNDLAYQLQHEIVYVMSGAEFEAIYGKKYNDKSIVEIVHLNYAKPSYILTTLDNMKSALGKVIIDEDTGSVVMIDTPQVVATMKNAIEDMENPLQTYIYDLQYAKADVLAEKLRARIDANAVGSVVADERSNQLVVRALPGRREEVEALIRTLDAKTQEVLIDARVIQIVFKPSFDIGVDWDFKFEDSEDTELQKTTLKNVFLNEGKLPSSDKLSSLFSKIAIGNINAEAFQGVLRTLKQVSDTKILSNPQLLVTNGEQAKIHVGDTVPYIISTTSGTGDNAITSEDVRFVDVGLKLVVTPTINEDQFITMKLQPEISTVVDRIQSKGGGIPQVNKTQVDTTVMVKDGNTVVLGGLKKDDKTQTKSGIPFLMDVPVIGRVFSRTSDSINSTEIVILITPHIVSGASDIASVRGTIKPFKTYEDEAHEDMKLGPIKKK